MNAGSPVRTSNVSMTLFVVLVAALLLWSPFRNFTTDDAFIHFRFARNLATGQGFAFNPGVPTYGDTSPAWVFLVAGMGRVLGAAGVPTDPADAIAPLDTIDDAATPRSMLDRLVYRTDAWRLGAKLLDLACLLLAVVVFARIARTMMGDAWLLATALFVIDPWLVKWGLAGMETPLAVLLALVALWRRNVHRNSGRIDWQTPLALGAGLWVRPEFGVLIVAYVIDVALGERRQRLMNLAAACIVPASVYAPWLIYAATVFGTWLPNTFAARRDVNYTTAYVVWKMARILGSAYAVPLLALGVALVTRRRLDRALAFPFLSLVFVLGFYVVWHVSVGSRYLLLVTPFALLLGYQALFVLTADARRLRAAAVAVTAVLLIGVQMWGVRFATQWPLGLDRDFFVLADWIARETPGDARIAAHEIGVLGHIGDREVVDLAALVSPGVVPYSRTASVAASLEGHHADYLLWNSNTSPDQQLLADLDGAIEPLMVREVHREGSSHGGGWQYYTVYRLDGRHRPE